MCTSGRDCGLEPWGLQAEGDPRNALGKHILAPVAPSSDSTVSLMVSFGHMKSLQPLVFQQLPLFEQLEGKKNLPLATSNLVGKDGRRW